MASPAYDYSVTIRCTAGHLVGVVERLDSPTAARHERLIATDDGRLDHCPECGVELQRPDAAAVSAAIAKARAKPARPHLRYQGRTATVRAVPLR